LGALPIFLMLLIVSHFSRLFVSHEASLHTWQVLYSYLSRFFSAWLVSSYFSRYSCNAASGLPHFFFLETSISSLSMSSWISLHASDWFPFTASTKCPPCSWICSMIVVCVPMASSVTVLPRISNSLSSSGAAVISLVSEAMRSCVRTSPLTVSTTFKIIGAAAFFVFSAAPRSAFPSMARCVFFESTISPIHSIQAYKASSSSIPPSIRLIVGGEAIPFLSSIYCRSHSRLFLHQLRLLRMVVLPQRNPIVTHTSISARSCFFSLPHR